MDRAGEQQGQIWDRVADETEPDEKRREGMRAALERYRIARGLLGGGGQGDEAIEAVTPVEGVQPVD